jgi:ABC-type uncharacterized transport system substrate-binding protein
MGQLALIVLLACSLLTSSARAEQTVLPVLSSMAGPYQEAFEGFKEEMGESFSPQMVDQGISIDKDVKVVVAFGGKAALNSYPARVALVYALAPGLIVERPSGAVRIMPFPRPSVVIARLKELQPSLHTVAIFWNSDVGARYLADLVKESRAAHLQILSNHVSSSAELPDDLRAIYGKADALWLWPDPAIVTPSNFTTLREFALSNRIPFYAPTSALLSAGGTASVSISIREQGRAAARAVKQILSDSSPEGIFYSETEEVVVSKEGMMKVGLKTPEPTSENKIKVVP